MEITSDIIRAAGLDAGNTSMRAAGRTTWNTDDHNAACREHNRLLDLIRAAGLDTGNARKATQVIGRTSKGGLRADRQGLPRG